MMTSTLPERLGQDQTSVAASPLSVRWAVAALLAGPALVWAAPALDEVTVIGATPLKGVGLTRDEVAAPVQAATAADLRASGASDLPDFLQRRFGGVHVNDIAGNGAQIDVNYRGFTASPLLGTPQGLSVYLDGVRQNQPFGEIVLWDLIPRGALASFTLMPGSNPVFGLNTLGGALVLETKDGRRHPGTSAQLTLGSHARRSLELEHGGANARGLHWYGYTQLHADQGWRVNSPSRVGQALGKLGWRDSRTELTGSLSLADTRLNGNGLQEQGLLATDWRSVYTRPDVTENRATLLNLTGRRELSDQMQLSGNAYWRRSQSVTFNGDINEEALGQNLFLNADDRRFLIDLPGNPYGLTDSYTENAARTPFPFLRCIAQALQGDEPGEKCNGLINRSRTRQSGQGLAAQLSVMGHLAGQRNQLVVGGAWDGHRIRYGQSTQMGYLNADRTVTGTTAFADGISGGTVDGEPLDGRVNLHSRGRSAGLYAMNTTSIAKVLHLSGSVRFNHTTVDTVDDITASGPGSLSGRHHFQRLNPALGAVYAPNQSLSLFAGYNEASRAPSAIELGCADPNHPCRLPNAMAGDPPLAQVVTKTWEMGLRGRTTGGLRWSASAFRATNFDDILFIASNSSGLGYFDNFGKTRRAGLELSLEGKQGAWRFAGHYTLLNATYESAQTVGANGNSTNSAATSGEPGMEGSTTIRPGDRIPLIPRQILKLHLDYAASPLWTVGAGLVAVSGSYARGNENNLHRTEAPYYLGGARTGGYAVVNLTAGYTPSPGWQWRAQVANVFDRRYVTAGQLGAAGFNGAGQFQARPFGAVGDGSALAYSSFLAPGAPRSFWMSVRHAFD